MSYSKPESHKDIRINMSSEIHELKSLIEILTTEIAELRNQVAGSIHLHKSILSHKEAALYCNLTSDYLYQLTSKNLIPYYKPRGKMMYFKRTELDDWLLKNRFRSLDEF